MDLKILSLMTFVASLIFAFSSEASSSHFYTVQISSPLKEREAHELVTKLKSVGVSTFEARVIIHGKKHFRVCSGYYESSKRAEEARVSVVRHTHRKNVFIQRLKGSQLPDRMVLGDFD